MTENLDDVTGLQLEVLGGVLVLDPIPVEEETSLRDLHAELVAKGQLHLGKLGGLLHFEGGLPVLRHHLQLDVVVLLGIHPVFRAVEKDYGLETLRA